VDPRGKRTNFKPFFAPGSFGEARKTARGEERRREKEKKEKEAKEKLRITATMVNAIKAVVVWRSEALPKKKQKGSKRFLGEKGARAVGPT